MSPLPDSAQIHATSPAQLGITAFDPSSSTLAVNNRDTQNDPSQGPSQTQYLGAPSVPKRSSSQSKLSASSNSMPDQSANNSSALGKKRSKESLKPKSRSGSLASSSSKQAAGAGSGPQAGEVGSKKKRRGGFLGILSCCSAPEDENEIELGDQAVPAKQAKVVKQKPERQAAPAISKPIPTTVGPTTPETAQPVEQGIGGPEYSEHKAASKPKMITRSSKDKMSPDKPGNLGNHGTTEAELPEPPAAPQREPPLPPLPPSNPATLDAVEKRDAPAALTSTAAAAPKLATAAEPPQLIMPEETVAAQGTTINDRTPTQEAQDSDVAMPDAPVVPAARETPSQDTAQQLAQTQMALPPPPPRNGQERSVASSTHVTPDDRPQQWLLPPLQSQLKGRKCLVLDLDETLVHSSFKVLHLPPLNGLV